MFVTYGLWIETLCVRVTFQAGGVPVDAHAEKIRAGSFATCIAGEHLVVGLSVRCRRDCANTLNCESRSLLVDDNPLTTPHLSSVCVGEPVSLHSQHLSEPDAARIFRKTAVSRRMLALKDLLRLRWLRGTGYTWLERLRTCTVRRVTILFSQTAMSP